MPCEPLASQRVRRHIEEIEIVSASLVREDGGDGQRVTSGETLTIQIDLKAQHPVEDPIVSFALHDGMSQFVFGSDTAAEGIELGRVDGEKRVRFRLRDVPMMQGKYWATLGVHSRDNERVYHVQDQRYSFEVRRDDDGRAQIFIPIDAEAEDL